VLVGHLLCQHHWYATGRARVHLNLLGFDRGLGIACGRFPAVFTLRLIRSGIDSRSNNGWPECDPNLAGRRSLLRPRPASFVLPTFPTLSNQSRDSKKGNLFRVGVVDRWALHKAQDPPVRTGFDIWATRDERLAGAVRRTRVRSDPPLEAVLGSSGVRERAVVGT
jgi:hypothetical protein